MEAEQNGEGYSGQVGSGNIDPQVMTLWTSLVAQTVKCLPKIWETRVQSLGREELLEKEMATHSSTIAWKIHGQRNLVGCSPWGL